MYLKRITAQGFKSFADKINIELNDGVTGIVGPNGSGKSNVVDAVRWVLGEQSVKSLRGDGNMTDVIFSGSSSRNSMNRASVTLVFDNSDKYLPVAFTEVSIKRIVYKDGTNEYYLNGEKCRLKDITSILLDTGTSKESFNIISQGQIEEIISSKPQDRRVMFEEAAGVLKYKKRKEDALRKLDRTHDNMNRLNDIIGDLEVQIEPLKKQKEKALIYNHTKEELEKIEIALIASDITKINEIYQKNKNTIKSLEEEILKISTSNTEGEAKIETFKLELTKLDEEINNKQKTLIELTTKVERINSEKQIILERKKYEVEDAKLHKNLLNLKEESLKINNDINNLKNIIHSISEDLKDIISDLNVITKQIDTVKIDKINLEKSLSDVVRNKTINDHKIDALKETIDNNNSLPFAVKNILNNPKLTGIHDAIGNIIEVDNNYSTAISTSLGASASFVIVDTEKTAKDAIRYLKETNSGRVTFFPLNVIKPKYIDDMTLNTLNSNNGFVGRASSLVKYDKKYQNIIENQLGNVIVAKDIDCANNISKEINYRYKIVTLDGELIHVGGSITGGRGKVRNIINDKYELEQLIKEDKNLVDVIKKLEERINECDNKLKILEDKYYLRSKNKTEKNQHYEIYQKQLNDLNIKKEDIAKEIIGTNNILSNNLSNEEEDVLNRYYEASKEKETLEFDLDNIKKKRQSLNEELEDYQLSVKKENSEVYQKNKELNRLEIEVNRADVKLDNLLNTLSETYSLTYEKACKNYKLEIPDNEARNSVTNLKRKIKDLGNVNLGAIEEYDRISERYEFLIGQREDLIGAENTLLEIIKEMDEVMIDQFSKTFAIIRKHFNETFIELFKGGKADLKLTDPNNLLETGIEIVASPPGKKLASISLLSGGEKTFTAISLLFAILKTRTVPFCILDEVEAALDEVNVDSFGKYINNLKNKTQFILITHKKKTMEYADVLYGITMQESGVSKLVSVKLEDIDESK